MGDSPRAAPPEPGLRQLFASGQYRWLYAATLHWNLARWIEMLLIPWIAYELTGSAWLVALIGFFRNAPLLVFGLAGGVVADRRDRRAILLATQGVNVAVSASVALLLVTHLLAYWQLIAASLTLGTTWVFDFAARRALLADMVDRRLVLSAFALDGLNQNATKVVGPLIGGALVVRAGVSGSYMLLALVYVGALLALLPLEPYARHVRSAAGTWSSNVRAGVGAVWAVPSVVGVLAITIAMNMLAFPYQQVLPVFAVQVLGLGADGFGALSAGGGLGSLLGAVLLTWLGRQAKVQGWLFVAGSSVTAAGLTLMAMSGSFALSLALLVVSGLGQSAFSSFQSTIIVNGVSAEMRGRAMGILALAIGSSPVGALIIGALASAYGPSLAIGVSAAVCFVLIVATTVAVPALRAPTHPPAPAAPRSARGGVAART